jgi:hypothetical protein
MVIELKVKEERIYAEEIRVETQSKIWVERQMVQKT